ncbi:hypothetical protein VPH35_038753 [Triticum aestivum]|uniref:Reverse transcriptase zinc-binding domain-containing protein n=3 Tax=Aegilops tauschii subsp. strangulata TaxID=200361 RepID=A0A453CHX0_AEGTS
MAIHKRRSPLAVARRVPLCMMFAPDVVGEEHAGWDGANLKQTFRRRVDESLYGRWLELLRLVSNTSVSAICDKPVWVLDKSRTYSVQSFYRMINFGGVRIELQDYIWKIKVPPNIHVFLWLIVHNMSLTRDNLAKR